MNVNNLLDIKLDNSDFIFSYLECEEFVDLIYSYDIKKILFNIDCYITFLKATEIII